MNRRPGKRPRRGEVTMLRERFETMRAMMTEHALLPLNGRRVLDVGCGHGTDLNALIGWGADPGNMYGIDMSAERVAIGRRNHPRITFACASADDMAFPNGYFDLVLMCTLMTSVLDESVARRIAASVTRVLKPGGSILWYDFRYVSPANRQTRAMRMKDIRRYFPAFKADVRTVTVLPPLARRLGWLAPFAYPVLRAIPALRTHYMAILTKTALAEDQG